MKRFTASLVALALLTVVPACTRETDISISLPKARARAESMTRVELLETLRRYVAQITAMRNEYLEMRERFKAVPTDQMDGKEAAALMKRMGEIERDLSHLTLRYDIYAEYYRLRGGNYEDIVIPW